jgi:hypothetical protein
MKSSEDEAFDALAGKTRLVEHKPAPSLEHSQHGTTSAATVDFNHHLHSDDSPGSLEFLPSSSSFIASMGLPPNGGNGDHLLNTHDSCVTSTEPWIASLPPGTHDGLSVSDDAMGLHEWMNTLATDYHTDITTSSQFNQLGYDESAITWTNFMTQFADDL